MGIEVMREQTIQRAQSGGEKREKSQYVGNEGQPMKRQWQM